MLLLLGHSLNTKNSDLNFFNSNFVPFDLVCCMLHGSWVMKAAARHFINCRIVNFESKGSKRQLSSDNNDFCLLTIACVHVIIQFVNFNCHL